MNITKIGRLLTTFSLFTTLFTVGGVQINKSFAQNQITIVGISDTSPEFYRSDNNILRQDQALRAGYHLNSPNKRYVLDMQTDGNLVLYKYDVKNINRQSIWSSRTNGKTVYWAVMQADGNFVLYSRFSLNSSNAVRAFRDRIGTSPYRLEVQNDGNVVTYDRNNKVIWASGIHDRVPPPLDNGVGETWGNCKNANANENKPIRDFFRTEIYYPEYPNGVSQLLCGKGGDEGYGFLHIEEKHKKEWTALVEEALFPFGEGDWTDVADIGIRGVLSSPDETSYGKDKKTGIIDRRKICFSREIYLRELNENYPRLKDTKTVTVIIRISDGAIITAFPNKNSRNQCQDGVDPND